MNLDHGDQVSVLARRAGRQQPQLPGALHCRGAIAGLELGVDVAHVGADGVQRGDGDVLSTVMATLLAAGVLGAWLVLNVGVVVPLAMATGLLGRLITGIR